MEAPDDSIRTNPARTALRRLMLGAFYCAVALIALLIGMAVLSITGFCFDPHGYLRIFGILIAAVLTPVALMLWILYRLLRRDAN